MTVKGLQGIADEGEKAAIANDLLGNASVEMAALLNQSADSTENLKNKASELGLVMSDESVDAAVNYTDAMDNLTRSFTGVKNNITSQLLPGFTMVLDGLTGLITGQKSSRVAQGRAREPLNRLLSSFSNTQWSQGLFLP